MDLLFKNSKDLLLLNLDLLFSETRYITSDIDEFIEAVLFNFFKNKIYLKVNWSEIWIILLVISHILIFILILITRKKIIFQSFLFFLFCM